MDKVILIIIPLIIGYLLDLLLGDPEKIPHPVRIFGNMIAYGEKALNKHNYRFLKGMLLAIAFCMLVFISFEVSDKTLLSIHPNWYLAYSSLFVFYGLANQGLINEGKMVFHQLHTYGIEAGRRQLSRIVGRDTSELSPQQIKIAVLETMSENLSDGVIAPLFYYFLAGIPGMMTYKMINTMDSMLGYRNERYEEFGKVAARLDDAANFLPARITALLMVMVSFSWRGLVFIFRYGHKHKSPNAGYPEAALAGILNCRFGGPNVYHGVLVEKPYIGEREKEISHEAIRMTTYVNHASTFIMVLSMVIAIVLLYST